MNKISLDAIEKAAKRVAAKHFLTGVDTQEDVDNVWQVIEPSADDENEATERFNDRKYYPWHYFEHWSHAEVFDGILALKCSIYDEMVKELQ